MVVVVVNPRLRLLAAAVVFGATVLFAPPATAAQGIAVVPLQPRPHERIAASNPTIVVEIRGLEYGSLDRGAIRMFVDGQRVDGVSVAGNIVQYTPRTALDNAGHRLEVDLSAAGEQVRYEWTFEIDGGAGTSASYSGGEALPAAGYGAFGNFYAIENRPFGWGDRIKFVFVGNPGGYGYVTFAGLPGSDQLVALANGFYYTIVIVPHDFAVVNPLVQCHFFNPYGGATVFGLHQPITVWTQSHARVQSARAPSMRTPALPAAGLQPSDQLITTGPTPPPSIRRTMPTTQRGAAPQNTGRIERTEPLQSESVRGARGWR